jgi:hypothetical protein
MPEIIIKATYLRGRSVFFHQLAKEHDNAGNHPVWEKLTEFAVDLEAQAVALERRDGPQHPPLADAR